MNPKVAAPLGLLGLGLVVVLLLVATRPEAERREEPEFAPLVRTVRVNPEPVQLTVTAHGTVVPRTESDLVPQVDGQVEWVSPALVAGGFFASGDELIRLEVSDYELARESARAAVARAESEASRSKKERDRQQRLADQSVASQARIDDAENAYRAAAAELREARARLERADRDLERTVLRAPFDGRVRQESVDRGQFVKRGDAVAKLYAVDFAEVRLPIPDRELSFLDLSLAYRDDGAEPAAGDAGAVGSGPPVVLRAEFAGREQEWRGRIVRTEGELDPKSRMVHVVARVDDPYRRKGEGEGAPLAVGLFVEAEIQGRRLERAYVVPRTALHDGGHVLVVDDEGRLHEREVEPVRVEAETAVLSVDHLAPGERVVTSHLAAPVEGMQVRVLDDEAAS